jgi:hypothetical protein
MAAVYLGALAGSERALAGCQQRNTDGRGCHQEEGKEKDVEADVLHCYTLNPYAAFLGVVI